MVPRRPVHAVVRPARHGDLPAVHALEHASFTVYRLNRRQLHYLHRSPTAIFFVAAISGRIVGHVITLIRRHGRTRSGRIYSLAVDAHFRGTGIGTTLVRQAMASLRHRNVPRVSLEVEQSNDAAIRLYKALGFRFAKVLPNYYGHGRHGVRMLRENDQRLLLAPGKERRATP